MISNVYIDKIPNCQIIRCKVGTAMTRTRYLLISDLRREEVGGGQSQSQCQSQCLQIQDCWNQSGSNEDFNCKPGGSRPAQWFRRCWTSGIFPSKASLRGNRIMEWFPRRSLFNFPNYQDFLFDFSKSLDYKPSRQSQESIVVCGVTLTDPLSRIKSETSPSVQNIIYHQPFRLLKEDSVTNLTQKNASSTPNLNVLKGTASSYFANLDKSIKMWFSYLGI